MQSTTRWCLNEGSMSSCTDDQNGVFHEEHKPPLVPHRSRVLQALCQALNQTDRVLTGARPQMHYMVASSS
jgi:hypothetical protein